MADVLNAVAGVVAALGTVLTGYLAYRLRVLENKGPELVQDLRRENLELGERLTALINNGHGAE